MKKTSTGDTPIYESTLQDTGCDVTAIISRPPWTPAAAASGRAR